MKPFIADDRSMRSQMEERLWRAGQARVADEARRARKTNSLRPAMDPEASWRLELATPAGADLPAEAAAQGDQEQSEDGA